MRLRALPRGSPGDQQIVAVADYDQLGRQRLMRQLETTSANPDDDTVGIKVQTRYLYGSGASYQLVSNPYRAGTSQTATSGTDANTMGWTQTTLDTNGRSVASNSFSGAGLPSSFGGSNGSTGTVTTVYANQTTTVADQAGVSRTNTVDGLGRLIAVVENGISATTNYSYL